MSSAEFGSSKLPGKYATDYIYASNAHADHFLDAGMKVFRVPFLWPRLQHDLNAEFDADELNRLRGLVSHITGRGGYALLDPHDYARWAGELIGSSSVPNTAFADFWSRLAGEFKGDDHVWFGLMNEPNGVAATQWLAAANAAIAGIRASGAQNLVLVPGVRWTGAHSWYSGDSGSNAAVMGGVVDPLDHYAYELHQYLDSDSSGTKENGECVSTTIGSERLKAVTGWLREKGKKGFLGEGAGANTATCAAAIADMLTYMRANQDVWFGFSWWAAGPWWGDYMFSLAPAGDGTPKPQEAWLTPFL
ncbi:MAG: glycoside hydrolase family 5 protein [Polyangiaceae bacterium]|nr:glycoside hydrolase family 5 protein [Polyangiaceae bacterium]MCB9607615.1 glycoside hydrolase family 5 protein [Polyangiaceae bacterium]